MRLATILAVTTCLALSAPALGQSFNLDLNLDGPPHLGGGVPSDAFGAAAGMPGRWNLIPAAVTGPIPLVDLTGAATGVSYSVTTDNNAGGGGFNFAGNTGGFALLLNDVRFVGTQVHGGHNTFRFSGLSPGPYDVYTYAVSPILGAPNVSVPVTVLEATLNQTQIVTGPMPGNSFEYLVTHSIHRVLVSSGGNIHVDIIQPAGLQSVYCVNGFQIVAVSEPMGWIAILTLSTAMLRRRIKETN